MAGQVMEAHHQAARLQQPLPTMMPPFAPLLPHNTCKHDVHHHHLNTITTTTMMATATSASTNNTTTGATAAAAGDMAPYLQQLQDAAAQSANNKTNSSSTGGGTTTAAAARGEQCPRCASHDTKFCYYNNYNTSQPRHFCRSCRRYWTLGGSLRNVPVGGASRKRHRLAQHQQQLHAIRRAAPAPNASFGLGLGGTAAPPTMMMPPLPSSSQGHVGGGLLGSLFALSGAAAPMLLEGRGGAGSSSFDFDLGLGLPTTTGPLHQLQLGGAGMAAGEAAAVQMQMQGLGLGLRGGGGGGTGSAAVGASSSSFFWPAGLLLDSGDSVDTWKMPGGAGGAGSIWPADFVSSPAAAAAAQTGGMLHGGAGHLM